MSHRLIARSVDLSRLRAEGYDIAIRSNYLVVSGIPYVTAKKEIKFGTIITDLTLANDVTVQPRDHTALFAGEYPCHQDGTPIEQIRNRTQDQRIDDDLIANHMFSAKPQPKGNYDDYYQKIATYAAILSSPAKAIDPRVTPTPFPVIWADDDETVFNYLDTASSRAEIGAVTRKLELHKVVIVGLGGTGSYVLDLVAKTPVKEIHLFDGDTFLQHNAFRSPGAPSGGDLAAKPAKVKYFAQIYGKMHRGVIAHENYLCADNVETLQDADFVFLCLDNGPAKRFLVGKLEEFARPFVDVGMGIFLHNEALGGILRTTTSTPNDRDHVWDKHRIPFSDADEQNEYDRNIQVADLNALNAAMAVIKWKKLCGFYIDLEHENNSTYTIDGNEIINEDAS